MSKNNSKIAKYDETGSVVETYDTAADAAKANSVGLVTIVHACLRDDIVDGHRFRRGDSIVDILPAHKPKRKRGWAGVAAYDNEGKLIRVFSRIVEAERELKVTGVGRALTDPGFHAGKMYWRRVGKDETPAETIIIPESRGVARVQENKAEREKQIIAVKTEKAKKSRIIEYDLGGNPTGRSYKNASEASRALDVTRQAISFHLTKETVSVAGVCLKRGV